MMGREYYRERESMMGREYDRESMIEREYDGEKV